MYATIAVAVIGVIGGATGSKLIDAYSRRKVTSAEARVTSAEAEAKIVDAANLLMKAQQVQIDRGDSERARLEVKVSALQTEVDNLHMSLREERLRCDAELHGLRLELQTALHQINTHIINTTPAGGTQLGGTPFVPSGVPVIISTDPQPTPTPAGE